MNITSNNEYNDAIYNLIKICHHPNSDFNRSSKEHNNPISQSASFGRNTSLGYSTLFDLNLSDVYKACYCINLVNKPYNEEEYSSSEESAEELG